MIIEIQINKSFGPYSKGQVVRVPATPDRTPLDQYWRARLKDASIDDSCHVRDSPSGDKKPARRKTQPKGKKPSGKKATVKLTTRTPTK